MVFKAASRLLNDAGVVSVGELLGWEVFLERPSKAQEGRWVDVSKAQGWLRIGLGAAVLCIARLPTTCK